MTAPAVFIISSCSGNENMRPRFSGFSGQSRSEAGSAKQVNCKYLRIIAEIFGKRKNSTTFALPNKVLWPSG